MPFVRNTSQQLCRLLFRESERKRVHWLRALRNTLPYFINITLGHNIVVGHVQLPENRECTQSALLKDSRTTQNVASQFTWCGPLSFCVLRSLGPPNHVHLQSESANFEATAGEK